MKNKRILFFLLLIFLSNIIFLSRLIFSNECIFQRDLMLQFKPWKNFINSSFKNILFSSDYLDFLPLWNPYNHCGTPFIGNIQAQIFYPFSLIFYLIKNFVVAFKIFLFLHLLLAGVFMFLMLKNKGFKLTTALTGALVWSFNGYIISRIEFLSVFSSIIWLPLMILIIDKLPNKKFSLKHSIYLSFCIAIQFLAGHTQMWFYSIIFCLLYCVFLSILNKDIKILFMFSLAVILSIAISSIQFLPTFEFILHSTRAGYGIKKFGMEFKDSAIFSLKFTDIINFLYPFNWQINFKLINQQNKVLELSNYWIYTFYTGILSIILSILGFLSKKFLKEKIFLSIIFILFLFYALGENFLFYGLFYKIFPIIRLFRYPATSVFIIVFVICIFSCYGVELISNFLSDKEKFRKILIFIPIFIFLELKYYSKKTILTLPSKILYEISETTSFLLNLKDINDYRIALTPKTQILARTVYAKNLYEAFKTYRDNLLGNINIDYHIYNFRGQDIELKNFYNFLDIVYSNKSLNDAIPFFSISNVKYILSSELQNVENCKLIFNSKNMKIYENPYALKKAYFVDKYIVEPNLEKSKSIIKNIKDKLERIAIIHTEEKNIKLNLNSFDKNVYELKNLQISNNKIFLEIENSSDGLLVISQNFYPGWKCYVNGCREKIYHCNLFMMCIPLRIGKNEVFLKFEPLSFKIGTILSLISILMCFLYLFEKGG